MKTTEGNNGGSLERVVRLHNAITEALREMERHPNDSPQDIWNESLKSWETGLWMNHRLEVQPNDPSSATRPTGRMDCKPRRYAGFAAAHG